VLPPKRTIFLLRASCTRRPGESGPRGMLSCSWRRTSRVFSSVIIQFAAAVACAQDS
jgi:hypothetical protein